MGINTEVEVEDSSTKFQDANQWRKHKSLTSAVVMVAAAERMGFYLCVLLLQCRMEHEAATY